MHGQVAAAGALSARISGDRLAALIPNSSMEVGRGRRRKDSRRRRRHRAARRDRVRSRCPSVSASRPSAAPTTRFAHALATAEIACKAAKDRGRNRVEMFQDSDQSIIRRHTDILVIGKLRDALGNDSFRLDAQPILPLRGNYGRPRFELLIRMLGDRGEIIPPGKFLSAAERYQLMPTVDRWVVHRACELLGEHSASVGEDIARFAINLVRPIAAGRVVPGVRDRRNQGQRPAARSAVLRADRNRDHRQSGQGAEFHAQAAGSGLPVRARRFRHRASARWPT